MSAPVFVAMTPCSHCGAAGNRPLGEFCPTSDPADPDFHDFGLCAEDPGASQSRRPGFSAERPSVSVSRRSLARAAGGRSENEAS